ncbi:restriction endonuclease [Paenibacillus lutimineralis]|uniref:Restriction endonuclease n=1 Tax=Paenibacillus lutimineralis TaxID=2707005 RepID=A0A3S9UWG4_9BACL|nr:restriction endonuclease [Paenibacillus lutimineralis]AZS14670.1 restriction endonuclease [Paenibacillus lutimineralis]
MALFENMGGLEFEKLIYNLFVKLGFRAQITKASGDGGIDIIANYEGLLFKGKYLIQCKRWKGKVGEPELRDLYGTVISENALKGILVTTSSFTRQAEEFSRGKNLELIDEVKLKELLYASEMSSSIDNNIIISAETNGFLQSPLFDSEKYVLLTDRINDDPSMEMPHTALINLLLASVLAFGADARTNGIINEAISRINAHREIFATGKTRIMKEKRVESYFNLALMELANGNYGKSYEYLLKSEGQLFKILRCHIAIAYILGFHNEFEILMKQAIRGIILKNGSRLSSPPLTDVCTKIINDEMKMYDFEIEYPGSNLISIRDFLNMFKIPTETKEKHRAYVKSFGKINE